MKYVNRLLLLSEFEKFIDLNEFLREIGNLNEFFCSLIFVLFIGVLYEELEVVEI